MENSPKLRNTGLNGFEQDLAANWLQFLINRFHDYLRFVEFRENSAKTTPLKEFLDVLLMLLYARGKTLHCAQWLIEIGFLQLPRKVNVNSFQFRELRHTFRSVLTGVSRMLHAAKGQMSFAADGWAVNVSQARLGAGVSDHISNASSAASIALAASSELPF